MTRLYRKTIFILFLMIWVHIIGFIIFWFAQDASVGFSLSQNDAVIGSSASVYPNQFNRVAEQLKLKEAALLEKEEDIQGEKNSLKEEIIRERQKILLYFSIIGGGLFILILLNFYFDSRRRA